MTARVGAPFASPELPPLVAKVLRLVRAGIAGAAATLVDLGVLALLVSCFGVPARVASLPALVFGGVANFVGNREFAFRTTARGASVLRQACLYALVEVVALGLNGALFDLVLRLHPETARAYPLVRLATSHVVFLCWSYPLWSKVFGEKQPAR